LIALVLALVLTLIYLIRIMLLTMLAGAAPLALACHALPHTEGLARLWWRAFGGVMAVQVAQALVLITTLRIFFDLSRSTLFAVARPVKSFLDLLLLICLLYILIRIPSWISRVVFRGGASGLWSRDDHDIGPGRLRRGRVFPQRAPGMVPRFVDAVAAELRVGAGEVDVFEKATRLPYTGPREARAGDPVPIQLEHLTGLELTQGVAADVADGGRFRGQ
jgi:hypothetical protein